MPPLNDLIGQTFTRLTVIGRDVTKKGVYWLCRCECGKVVSVRAYNLTSGSTKSCGCLNDEIIRSKRRNSTDLTGRRYGHLEVLRYVGSDHNGTIWECKCHNCGAVKSIPAAWLKNYSSCGCLAKESAHENVAKMHEKVRESESNPSIMRTKANSNNTTTGIRGVCFIKSTGKYVAYIRYKNIRYTLCRSKDLEPCVKARRAAEEAIHEDFTKWLEEYKKED